jgi:hypothetical protein
MTALFYYILFCFCLFINKTSFGIQVKVNCTTGEFPSEITWKIYARSSDTVFIISPNPAVTPLLHGVGGNETQINLGLGSYSLIGKDLYGDGWNGATITITTVEDNRVLVDGWEGPAPYGMKDEVGFGFKVEASNVDEANVINGLIGNNNCEAGSGNSFAKTSGQSDITTEFDCKYAAKLAGRKYIGYVQFPNEPKGCIWKPDPLNDMQYYILNTDINAISKCSDVGYKCIDKLDSQDQTCFKCPADKYSSIGGINAVCMNCPGESPTTEGVTGVSDKSNCKEVKGCIAGEFTTYVDADSLVCTKLTSIQD